MDWYQSKDNFKDSNGKTQGRETQIKRFQPANGMKSFPLFCLKPMNSESKDIAEVKASRALAKEFPDAWDAYLKANKDHRDFLDRMDAALAEGKEITQRAKRGNNQDIRELVHALTENMKANQQVKTDAPV